MELVGKEMVLGAVLRQAHPELTRVAPAAFSAGSILLPYPHSYSELRRIVSLRVFVTRTHEPVVAPGSGARVFGEILNCWKAPGAVLVRTAHLVVRGESQPEPFHEHRLSREDDGT
jgi:hypothetical protein